MLYSLNQKDKSYLSYVKTTTLHTIGWLEKDFENLLAKNISLIIPENQLMIIFQQRSFQEEADIMALDSMGKLFIFELKRWQSSPETMLQVLRYGQKFGQYKYEDLESLLQNYYEDDTISLQKAHHDYFFEQIGNELLERTKFNNDQVFVIITNGADLETLRAIRYWKSKGLPVEYLPYKVYQHDKEIFLEISSFNPENEVLFEIENDYFIVNTNTTWSKTNYREMIEESKASAYGERRYSILRLKKNDHVYLYHNRVGIIASARALSEPIKDEEQEEYKVKLKFSWVADPDKEPAKAVSASELNKKLGTGYGFRQTVFAVDEEMAKAMEEIHNTK